MREYPDTYVVARALLLFARSNLPVNEEIASSGRQCATPRNDMELRFFKNGKISAVHSTTNFILQNAINTATFRHNHYIPTSEHVFMKLIQFLIPRIPVAPCAVLRAAPSKEGGAGMTCGTPPSPVARDL
jgi:hypothetical protein